jgi:large conductance mechanosensitive channel
MIKGFKEFLLRGNVLDLAVAIVIGAAFTMVINAVVMGFINPLIAAIFGKPDLTHVLTFSINGAQFSIGLILNALLNFVLVAAAIYFFIVVPVNAIRNRRKRGVPDPEVPPTETDLLIEIRDLLAQQRGTTTAAGELPPV